MIEDIYEPLERYDSEYRELFKTHAEAAFDELFEKSCVSKEENAKLVKVVRRCQKAKNKASTEATCGCLVFWISIIALIAGILMALSILVEDGDDNFWKQGLITAAISSFVAVFVYPKYKAAQARLAIVTKELEEATQAAWDQMAPLNRLYDWDITPRLFEKTVPRVAFDPYFNEQRMQDLRDCFGWDESFNDGKSILGALSGEINSNPFIFCHQLAMEWGSHTYYGHMTIHWTETEVDSKGRRRRVRRSETLTGSVTKPKPFFPDKKLLIYANDAAPALNFSRQPNSLSGLGDGFVDNIRKKAEMKSLKKFSENLDDESQYTLMSNHDFELLFHSTDRSDEVQFRLLFTPLAQQQMVRLLKDKKIGYGDDFSMAKNQKITTVGAWHLDKLSIDTDPTQFAKYDLEEARKFFVERNCELFKALYFTLAPVLTIPLYQQTRTHEAIYEGILPPKSATLWECEAIANYMGEDFFKHPDCITQNILKTRLKERNDSGDATVEVTAFGFRGVTHVYYDPVYGGDGKLHNVPVEWIEYLPVSNQTDIGILEMEGLSRDNYSSGDENNGLAELLGNVGTNLSQTFMRRSVISFLRNEES